MPVLNRCFAEILCIEIYFYLRKYSIRIMSQLADLHYTWFLFHRSCVLCLAGCQHGGHKAEKTADVVGADSLDRICSSLLHPHLLHMGGKKEQLGKSFPIK